VALQFRRGTESERSGGTFVPALGEPVYTTDTKRLYIGDDETTGGNPVGYNNDLNDLADVTLRSQVDIPISSISATSNVVTVITTTNHGFLTGDSVLVSTFNKSEIDGVHQIQVFGTSSFRYTLAVDDFAQVADSGAVRYDPADNSILAYDQETAAWIEQDFVYRFEDLGDVKISNPQADDIVQYTEIPLGNITDGDGNIVESGVEEPSSLGQGLTWTQTTSISKFTNQPFIIDVDNLSDVLINSSTLSDRQILAYDSTIGIWRNRDYVDSLGDLSDVVLTAPSAPLNNDFKVVIGGRYAERDVTIVSVDSFESTYELTAQDLTDAASNAATNGTTLDEEINSLIAEAHTVAINGEATLAVTATRSGAEIILTADDPEDAFVFSVALQEYDNNDGFTPTISRVEPDGVQVLAYDGTNWINDIVTLNNINLNYAKDVNLGNVQDGQILQYNALNGQWQNADKFINFAQFADVSITDPQHGDTLIYDQETSLFTSKKFILNDLGDVNDTSSFETIPDGSVLAYDESEDKWKPKSFASLSSRSTVTFNTGPIENLAIATVDFEAFTGYLIFNIQVSAICTTTLYVNNTVRLNDLDRDEATPPTTGTGILAEMTPSNTLTNPIAPVLYGFNDAVPITRTGYAKIRNRSGYFQSNIQVTLTLLQIEEDPEQAA